MGAKVCLTLQKKKKKKFTHTDLFRKISIKKCCYTEIGPASATIVKKQFLNKYKTKVWGK